MDSPWWHITSVSSGARACPSNAVAFKTSLGDKKKFLKDRVEEQMFTPYSAFELRITLGIPKSKPTKSDQALGNDQRQALLRLVQCATVAITTTGITGFS